MHPQIMKATHATVSSLTRRVEGVNYKFYIGNFFSSPDLFDDLHTRVINCCGTVRQNCKGMLESFDYKTLKLIQYDIHSRVRGNLTAVIWKDKQDVHILMNTHR
jgi:hypothetical protein